MSDGAYPPALIADLRARYPAIVAVVRSLILDELRSGELAEQVRAERRRGGEVDRMSLAAARVEAQLAGQGAEAVIADIEASAAALSEDLLAAQNRAVLRSEARDGRP